MGDTSLLDGDQDEESLLASLGNKTLSGLGYIGGSLDKALGGRAIRGLLDNLTGGDTSWSELASIIPFSDTMGLTDNANAASGRDILENLGAPKNKEGFHPIDDPADALWDTAGFLAEVGLDPGTYASFGIGAVGKGGALLKKVGALPKGIVARQTGTLGKVLAEGGSELAEKVAGAAKASKMDDLADIIGRGKQEFGPVTAEMANAGKQMPMRFDPHAAMDDPLGGLVGFGKPTLLSIAGVDVNPSKILGTGPTAQKVGGFIDKAVDAAKYSAVGRQASRVFDPAVQDLTEESSQRVARKHASTTAHADAPAREFAMRQAIAIKQAIPDIEPDEIRAIVEGQFDLVRPHVAAHPAAKALQEAHRAFDDAVMAGKQQVGIKVDPLIDEAGVEHAHRFLTGAERSGMASRLNELKDWYGGTNTLKTIIKDDLLRDVNFLPRDKDAVKYVIKKYGQKSTHGEKANAAFQALQKLKPRYRQLRGMFESGQPMFEKEIDELNELTSRAKELKGVEKAEKKILRQQAAAVASMARHSLEPWQTALGGFGNDTIRDILGGTGAGLRATAKTREALENVAVNAKWLGDMPLNDPDYVRLVGPHRGEGLLPGDLNLTPGVGKENTGAINELLKHRPDIRSRVEKQLIGAEADKIAKRGGVVPPDDEILKSLAADKVRESIENHVKEMVIPKKIAEDVRKRLAVMAEPENVLTIMKVVDSFTNLFKTMVLNWPSRYVRDANSAIIHGAATGNLLPRDLFDAADFVRGMPVESLLEMPEVTRELARRGLQATPENATDVARELAYREVVVSDAQGARSASNLSGVPERAATGTTSLTEELPGGKKQTFREKAKEAGRAFMGKEKNQPPGAKKFLRFWDVHGVTDLKGNVSQETKHPFARAGNIVGREVENFPRIASWFNGMRKGMSAREAAENTRALYVDYRGSAYTRVERDYLLRLFPFYKFTRKMVPAIVRELSQHPGGGLGVAIRGINDAQRGQFVPDYLQGQLAIPIGEGDEGTQRYLTSLGLPIEQLNLFHGGPRGITETGLDILGQMNPLVKGGLEQLTGRQFYSDRDLRDLDPRSGRILEQLGLLDDPRQVPQIIDQLLLNSPGARYLSAAGQIVDSRKGPLAKATNLLTGARISDVDLNKQREIETRKIIDELLRGQPGVRTYERLYVSPEEMMMLSDEEKALYNLSQSISKRAQQRKRAEKARAE